MPEPEPSAASKAEIIEDEIRMEKNAGLIMGTNNSSIVSKRSVEKLYLPEPHFYRYFVRKPQRRSPTINRGYWLRMRAVDWVIRQFLERPSDQPKVIINLGCGYDPLPFQWMAREPDLCQNTRFIDIDYEELMISKHEIIKNTPKMSNMLRIRPDALHSDKSVLLDTVEYAAIGCDLRNLPRLQRLVRSVIDIQQCLVLCIAEVSITYMHTEAADSLIAWTATLSPDVTFCLLEQGSPDRPDHPFTATMLNHFKKLGTPLHSVFEYPGNHTQAVRFQRAGYTHCETENLWELWSDPRFLSPSQRLALDQVEPFDEWEDFALFASHYLLVTAHNRRDQVIREGHRSRRDSIASIASDISARTASPWNPDSGWFAMKHCEDKSDETKRHHGSAYQMPDQDAIAVHGGIGPKGRLSSTAVSRGRQIQSDPATVLPIESGARCCHTITTLGSGQNILVGGRASPTQPMQDCWLQTGSSWTRIHDLPEPRYRHRTCPVTLPDDIFGAVVFGGKTGASKVAIDVLLWDPRTGWSTLKSLQQDPIPRFGASFMCLGFNHGLLFGGMRMDGVICQGLWRWRLVIRDSKVAGISFRTSNALDASVGAYPWFSRLGASCGLIRDELLVIGGVAKSGCIPRPFEMLSILGSFSAFNEHEKEMRLRLTSVTPITASDCPRPFLVGHSTHRTKTGTLVIVGGGATCFSFGNYFSSGLWILHEREAGLHIDWTLVKLPATIPPVKSSGNLKTHGTRSITDTNNQTAKIGNSDEFLQLVRASLPVVMKIPDLGPCLSHWTPDYFRSKISPDRKVVIHEAQSRHMNFQRKDFAYKTLGFHDFLDTLTSSNSHVYLRALSSSNPTTVPASLSKDWPELSGDVQIPSQLASVLNQAEHSSCLRVSNDTTMWLHYDVMANVLFQIHGIKKLVLFPPSDIKSLSFPPGSTTSELDIFRSVTSSQDVDCKDKGDNSVIDTPEHTNPQIFVLHPGDALYIPPLWAHTGISVRRNTTSEPTKDVSQNGTSLSPPTIEFTSTSGETKNPSNQYINIALNVFFRSFPSSKYAHGRDVYGNRDLAAYEDGRRDIDRIVRRFTTAAAAPTSVKSGRATTKSKQVSESDDLFSATPDGNDDDKNDAGAVLVEEILESIPKDVSKAYLERLADELRRMAAEM